MKIYTRGGDSGETHLFGGLRVSKTDSRVQACGLLDELNATIGLADSHQSAETASLNLSAIQDELFQIGAFVGALGTGKSTGELDLPPAITRLESDIDAMQEVLKPLKNFVLPGGCPLAAALHLCRAVCRRAEIGVLQALPEKGADPPVIAYLNRLSDWFFVSARFANQLAGSDEVVWRKR